MQFLKRFHYNSPVILTFAILSLIALFLGAITKGYTNTLLFSVYRSSLKDPLSYIRIFTHVLGHVNFQHFFNNFLIILMIGPILEEKYGSVNILSAVLITSFITGICQVVFSRGSLIGASGIAFMLITLISFANISKGRIPITIVLIIFMYLGREVYNGILSKDNISQATHIIGAICGIIFGIFLNRL